MWLLLALVAIPTIIQESGQCASSLCEHLFKGLRRHVLTTITTSTAPELKYLLFQGNKLRSVRTNSLQILQTCAVYVSQRGTIRTL